MADTAAHVVDHVIPAVPVRQWVLSLPRTIRYILARDAKLLSGALGIFVGEIFRDLRRRAGIRRAADGRCGAVTGIQRFGGSLNLNIHFHTIVLDGLYMRDGDSGAVRFRRLPSPSRDDLARVLLRVRRRILRFLASKGFPVEVSPEEGEESCEVPSVLETFQAASIRGWIALGGEARRVSVLGAGAQRSSVPREKPFCVVSGDGWSLEAAVRLRSGDREGLERLCRYILRPPFAEDRLARLPDGRILYEFRRPRFDGSTHMVLTAVEFLEKLAALVAPPRSHLVSYHGVLAPNSRWRNQVVPPPPSSRTPGVEAWCGIGSRSETDPGPGSGRRRVACAVRPRPGDPHPPGRSAGVAFGSAEAAQEHARSPSGEPLRSACPKAEGMPRGLPERGEGGMHCAADAGSAVGPSRRRGRGRRKRTAWAELLRRSMGIDVLACPRCSGRMELIACITEREVVRKILRAMGLSDEAPRAAPARPPPQTQFEFVQDSMGSR